MNNIVIAYLFALLILQIIRFTFYKSINVVRISIHIPKASFKL